MVFSFTVDSILVDNACCVCYYNYRLIIERVSSVAEEKGEKRMARMDEGDYASDPNCTLSAFIYIRNFYR